MEPEATGSSGVRQTARPAELLTFYAAVRRRRTLSRLQLLGSSWNTTINTRHIHTAGITPQNFQHFNLNVGWSVVCYVLVLIRLLLFLFLV